MANTVVFLWISVLGAPAATVTVPSPAPLEPELALLSDFGATRGITLRQLSREHAGFPAYDAALADRIEGELEQARTALSALEEDAASARLERVTADLLAHPHLPQAAFLMAECAALGAALARPNDPSRAAQLELDRAALEGARARAFGESSTSTAATAPQSLRLTGLAATDAIELDGSEVSGASVEVLPGLHHFRVWRGGRAIFATFARVAPEQRELELAAPPLRPCSEDDLAPVSASGGRSLPSSIACERWAMARSEPGGVGVALCQRNRCGAFVHWSARPLTPFSPLEAERSRVPSWAAFVLAGVATAAATSFVLWQAGAFDSDSGRASTFRYAGVQPQGIRF